MDIELSKIKEAQTEELFTVLVPVNVSTNGNGQTAPETIEVKYRAITEKMLSLLRVSEQLEAIVADLGLTNNGVKIEAKVETLENLPVPFLRHLMNEIVGDYYPKFNNSPNSKPGIRKVES